MTRLLVSVRDASEARLALQAGVDLIDVKEPAHGSLGFAGWQTIRGILSEVADRAPVSAALGELREFDRRSLTGMPPGLRYVKAGLAGCASALDWPAMLERLAKRLPSKTSLVAVVYADRESNSPRPYQILAHAQRLGCAAVLVDTFDKSAGDLLAHWSLGTIDQWIRDVQAAGMLSVIAGSLSLEMISDLLALRPDYVAVRGAACRASRSSKIDRDKLAKLAASVASHVVQRSHAVDAKRIQTAAL